MNIKKWHQEEAEDQEEDALSLCDLPIYGNALEWENYYSCDSQSSSSHSLSTSLESEIFEFFSEEWNKPAATISPNNLPPEKIIFCGKLIPQKEPVPENDKKGRKNKQDNSTKTCGELHCKAGALQESSETSSSSRLWRSRWFLFLFGMAGFPKQMDLKDMKNRQRSRKTASSPPRQEQKGNRVWWMIRALSCSGGDGDTQVHAQAIVKASIGCIAHM